MQRTDEIELERLKDRATQIGKYYCKGFGDYLCCTRDDVVGYALHYPNGEKDRVHAQTGFEKIRGFYSRIPFDSLSGDSAFTPLFDVRNLLVDFERVMNETFQIREKFNGEPNSHPINEVALAIGERGQVYRDSFSAALHAVRNVGCKDFKLNLVDLSGRVWHIGRI